MPDQKAIQALPTIIQRLRATYPNARYELNYESPLQLLVATILAAQCTDERVNQVTPALFKKYPDAKAYATAGTIEVMRRVLDERFGIPSDGLAPEQALDTLGLDSLGFVEYVFEVEKALKISLTDVPRDITTVGGLTAFIDAEVRKQARGVAATG